MKRLKVDLKERSYEIHISQANWQDTKRQIQKHLQEDQVYIITHPRLKKLYQKDFEKNLKPLSLKWLTFPEGEKHKTLTTIEKLATQLTKHRATRNSLLLAFGGGVVGDVTGFLASMYMRGIRFIQIPTTLLAQVDSSVGGKTGVDLITGKNLVGAFYQPKAVLIHTDFLKTLNRREFLAGMAEVIKYGVIWDEKFFRDLAKHQQHILQLQPQILQRLICRSCEIKAEVVKQDEKESSLRAILNFGHTLGHAIESLSHYQKFKHGEAIAIGMLYATKLAIHLKQTSQHTYNELKMILEKFHLPTQVPAYSFDSYFKAIQSDKKASQNNIRFILPQKIGKVNLVKLKPREILQCLKVN